MRHFSYLAALTLLTIFVGTTQANAVLIDFSTFTAGDTLATVNAVSAPQGATFSRSTISSDPFIVDLSGTNVARATTNPPEADILINFSAPIDFLRVVYADNPEAVNLFTLMRVFSAPQGIVINVADVLATTTGNEPTTLTLTTPNARAAQLESFGKFIYLESVEFSFQDPGVPEPGTLALFGLGLAGLGFARRRKVA